MKKASTILVFGAFFGLLAASPASGWETERQYLSGTGYGDPVAWEFMIDRGRRSGVWTTIPVPSQWELQGFGTYNYGHDEDKSREVGHYRHRFRVPEAWHDRRVELVFEGVMTDAEVTVNGRSAGPRHQGGFYRFGYDVTELLDFEAENVLEVRVWESSADRSVELAERDADYWVFGGVYRPVYLEASPVESIADIAVTGTAGDPSRRIAGLSFEVFLLGDSGPGLGAPAEVVSWLETEAGERVSVPELTRSSAEVAAGVASVRLTVAGPGVRRWSAEHPNLYRLVVELRRGGRPLHRTGERVGVRKVELLPGVGLLVNGRRVLLYGVNRHAFWPPSGRTLNSALDRRDAELIKAMNLNAVRTSHYPPDVSFLDACDELGIYVVDELAGWHDPYDDRVGRKLVREMVARDRNRPSVIFWANGNEGGWNGDLDETFREQDRWRRPVIHPDATRRGIDARHYPTYPELAAVVGPSGAGRFLRNVADGRWGHLLERPPFLMPTEILHGLYDGGSGAGLEDYRRLLGEAPGFLGMFLWSFTDESVVRTDLGGVLDSDGNHAPDGVLGPYREVTGSYHTLRALLSPVQLAAEPALFDGTVEVVNRFVETDLADCRFHWSQLDLPGPGERWRPELLATGEVAGPAVPPRGRGTLALPLDPSLADAVRITARDPHGRSLRSWLLPARDPRADVRAAAEAPGPEVRVEEGGEVITLAAAGTTVEIDRRSGELLRLSGAAGPLPLGPGPRLADGRVAAPATVEVRREGRAAVVEARGGEGLEELRWRLYPSGWLRLDFTYSADGLRELHGVHFPLPAPELERLRWLGRGPSRVWRNRLEGGTLGVWSKDAAASTPPTSAAEPKLPGFYRGVVWARLETAAGELVVAPGSDDLFLGVLAPELPADARDAVAEPGPGGVGLYHGIPAIGTKFHPAADLGPQGQPYDGAGSYRGTVWLYPGRPGAAKDGTKDATKNGS